LTAPIPDIRRSALPHGNSRGERYLPPGPVEHTHVAPPNTGLITPGDQGTSSDVRRMPWNSHMPARRSGSDCVVPPCQRKKPLPISWVRWLPSNANALYSNGLNTDHHSNSLPTR